jgi:hypothetical protein
VGGLALRQSTRLTFHNYLRPRHTVGYNVFQLEGLHFLNALFFFVMLHNNLSIRYRCPLLRITYNKSIDNNLSGVFQIQSHVGQDVLSPWFFEFSWTKSEQESSQCTQHTVPCLVSVIPLLTPNMMYLVSLSLYVTSFLHQCDLFGFFWHQLVTSGFPWQGINDGHLELPISCLLYSWCSLAATLH